MRFSSSILGWPLLCSSLISAQNTIPKRNPEIVTIYATAAASAPSASYTTQSSLIDSTLNSTNYFRSQHNATALTWNTSLADAASSWASTCQWRHSGGATGENLALGYPNMPSAIDAWGNERTLYDFSAPTGFGHETGHFTQLVWKDTTFLGCAAVDCSGKNSLKGYVVVCEYWPPGNVVGQGNAYFRANVQAQLRVETRRSSISTLEVPTTSQLPTRSEATTVPPSSSRSTQTTTDTVVQVVTSANFMATSPPRAKSTVWALGEGAAADQMGVRLKGRWALGVAVAAMVVAGAVR